MTTYTTYLLQDHIHRGEGGNHDHGEGGGVPEPGTYIPMYLCVYIGSSRLLELPKPWGKGVGWDVNVHVNLRQQLMLRTRGVGGVEGDVNIHVNLRQDVNVHVNLRQQLMLRTRGVGWVGWDVNVHVNLRLDVNIHVNLRQQLMMM